MPLPATPAERAVTMGDRLLTRAEVEAIHGRCGEPLDGDELKAHFDGKCTTPAVAQLLADLKAIAGHRRRQKENKRA